MDKELMKIKESIDKWDTLKKLKTNSMILLTNGEECKFIRLKRKKFIGMINGSTFDIPVNMFKEVLEEAKENVGYKTLKKGELFYITDSRGNDALLYKFDSIKNNRIIGINPLSNVETSIDVSLYRGKVLDIK